MALCKSSACIGWTLADSDVYCAWCGTRLLELSMLLQQKKDGRWETLEPPALNFDQRPELQLVLRNTGQTGPIVITPAQILCSVPWIGLETTTFKAAELNVGDLLNVGVSRFKVPDGDSRYTADLSIALTPGGTDTLSSLTLEIVPRPQLDLDMPVTRVQLEPASNVLDIGLRLIRGRATLTELPQFEGGWAQVEWGDGITPPVTLDSNASTRVALKLRLRNESSETFAATTNDVILRRGNMLVKCVGREDAPIKIPVELEMTLAPELYIEPFRDRKRMDWALVRGITDNRPLVLLIYNGFPKSRGHSELEIRRIEATSSAGAVTWLRGTELPAPITLKSGQSYRLPLLIDTGALTSTTPVVQLTIHTNSPRSTPYYLKVELKEPTEFNGWLVVDLGTTNSCAALLDDNRAFEMVVLDESPQEKATTMPSVVGYQRVVSALEYEVGGKVWSISHLPDVNASVVMAAKRRIGTDRPFIVVPQKEPAETCELPARDVMQHLYSSILTRATETLAAKGETAVIISRIIVAHPSRFTMHQIDELKGAVRAAMIGPLTRYLPGKGEVRDLRTIHEPLGAALHFLNDWKQQAMLHQARGVDDITYSLLVYDFGGGTIDITLLIVHSTRGLRPGMQAKVLAQSNGGNGSSALETSETALLPVLMKATLARCQSMVALQGGVQQSLPVFGVTRTDDSDVARNNTFLLEQFVRSVMRVMPRESLEAGDETGWNSLRSNPHVNDRLALTAMKAGQKVRQEFTRQDVLPTLWDVREGLRPGPANLQPVTETAEAHAYSYTVVPRVVGATGHRWLGGEDVTAMMRDLLVERTLRAVQTAEKSDEVALPLDADTCPIHQARAARNNTSLMRKWAEETKILLSRGVTREELAARTPTLELLIRNQLRPYAGTQLATTITFPPLEDLHRRLEPALAQTVTMASKLVEHEGLAGPDVVLRVGSRLNCRWCRAFCWRPFRMPCTWPRRMRRNAWCRGLACNLYRAPGSLCPTGCAGGGSACMTATDRLSATTSRIGIKIVDCGKTWFHEILPAGEPIPDKGLARRVSGFGVMPGSNRIPVLENAGGKDEMLLSNGQKNPNIDVLGIFDVVVPSDIASEALSNVDLELTVDADINLALSVYIGTDTLLGPFNMIPGPRTTT